MTLKEHLNISARSAKLVYSLNKKYFISSVIKNIITAVLPYVPIYFSARLIDALAVGAKVQTLAIYAALTVGIVALLSLINEWLTTLNDIGFEEVYRSSEWMHAEKAMELAYSSIEDRNIALLRERIQSETQTGYNFFYFAGCMCRFVRSIVQIISSVSLTVSFFMVDSVSLWAKLVLIGGIAVTTIISMFTTKKSSQLMNEFFSSCVEENIRADKYNQYITDYKSGKDVRLYNMCVSLEKFSKGLLYNLYKREAKATFGCAGLDLISTLMNYLLRFGIYLLLIFVALGGGLSVGSIAQYVSCIMLLLTAISGIVSTLQLSFVNHEYLKRFFSYFDIPNPMYKGTLSVEKRDDDEYYIEFRNVSFKYPNTEAYALRNVNLKFKVGEKLAVVGMNGSGKTTFIKLLCRLYDPTEGEILLNGVNIKKYDYNEYLSIFSVVFQDFKLFAFSLGQNIAAGAHYDKKKATACLKKAGFENRLSTMPNGLETVIYHNFDPSGIEISGGEAQKIALARALYKDAPFIILDEPTAALDPVSEYEVYSKFNDISGSKTAIYISHRLASCRFCDEILVFDAGYIVQHGTHEVLLAQTGGKYSELWNAQAQYYVKQA